MKLNFCNFSNPWSCMRNWCISGWCIGSAFGWCPWRHTSQYKMICVLAWIWVIVGNIIRKIFRLTGFTNQWPTRISIATRRSAIETNTKSIVVWQSISSIWATIGCDWNIIELYKFRSLRIVIKLLKNSHSFQSSGAPSGQNFWLRNLTKCIGFHKSGSIFHLWWYLNSSESSNETNFVLSQRCSRSMHIRWRNILFISFISVIVSF